MTDKADRPEASGPEPTPRSPGRPGDAPRDGGAGQSWATRESDAAWRSVAYLITGPFTFGGIGWLIDRWAGTGLLTPVGIVGGMALSLYLIWFRYGTH